MSFSQRMGLKPANKAIQLESIDQDLRNGLWNNIKIFLLDTIQKHQRYNEITEFKRLSNIIWMHFYKLPIDNIPDSIYRVELSIRDYYFKFEWFEVYDFIEFIANTDIDLFNNNMFKESCNDLFERENSGYRFLGNQIAPITNSAELDEIEEAIDKSKKFSALKGVNEHLRTALEMLSDRKNPDYRNSIKESISAVESTAKRISENNRDTLGGALDKIKGKAKIHPSLERAFKQLYGYTSDADGIRHALMEDSNCDFDDAKFMLVSCSAFVNYLISRANNIGTEFNK